MAFNGNKTARELQLENELRDVTLSIRSLWEKVEEMEAQINVLNDMVCMLQVQNNELRMSLGRRPRYP